MTKLLGLIPQKVRSSNLVFEVLIGLGDLVSRREREMDYNFLNAALKFW